MGTPVGQTNEELIAQTDAWFLRRGIPHFIEDYRATEDVFTRALPALSLIFLIEIVGATNLTWPWWANTLALVGGAALALGLWAAVNRMRGRRWSQLPDDVGPVELTLFVLIPAVLPVVFGTQLAASAGTVVTNLVILGIVYLVVSYGLVPMTRWALSQALRQLGAIADLFGRALPLLLLFSVALFINTEVWQVAASLDGHLYWTTIFFFVLVGVAFLALRLPGELHGLRQQLTGDALVDACRHSPLREAATRVADADDNVSVVPMTRRQQGNVLLVLFFSQAVQILLVTATIGVFFFGFGLVAIRPEVIDAWLGDIGQGVLWSGEVFGREIEVTRALIHVSGFLATLSGFYFTVYVITDATYRKEFFNEIIDEVRQSLAVRNIYLALRARSGG